MAQTMISPAPSLFNNPIETGIRAVVFLDAAFPRAFDLTEIVWFDHLVVHTEDIGGPPSLHPDVPQRSGELLVRRRLVEEGLLVMRRLHLIEFTPNEDAGLQYRASEEATGIVEIMRTPYANALRERAEWLVTYICKRSRIELEQLITERIGRWRIEFDGSDQNWMQQ